MTAPAVEMERMQIRSDHDHRGEGHFDNWKAKLLSASIPQCDTYRQLRDLGSTRLIEPDHTDSFSVLDHIFPVNNTVNSHRKPASPLILHGSRLSLVEVHGRPFQSRPQPSLEPVINFGAGSDGSQFLRVLGARRDAYPGSPRTRSLFVGWIPGVCQRRHNEIGKISPLSKRFGANSWSPSDCFSSLGWKFDHTSFLPSTVNH